MWYYDSTIIKTPKTMVIGGITYPPGIFNDSSMLASLGIKPYTETKKDEKYYFDGAYSVDTSGATVVGTYAGDAKDVATLKARMNRDLNEIAKGKLEKIDWYWQRAVKGGTAVPSNIASYATAIYSELATKEGEINALDTIAKIIEYEARAYTETRKEHVLNEDGSFKEYHASNTYTQSLNLNMIHYWVATHPDEVDAGRVSMVAD